MKTLCNLPDSIVLPTGETLKPVIGGHLENKPFLTVQHSGVDVTKNGWGGTLAPDFEHTENRLIMAEAKRQKLKYRQVCILGRNLRGKRDLYGSAYRGTHWVFVETVKA